MPQKMEGRMEKNIERYRAMVNVCLQDAQQPALSMGSRANSLFDAVYMLCRIVMNGDDDGLEHPTHLVLLEAWSRMGWKMEEIQPAFEHLRDWYVPELAGCQYEKLMKLAARLNSAIESR